VHQWFFKYISADPQDFDVTAMYNMDRSMRTATCKVGFLFRAADCKEPFPDAQLLLQLKLQSKQVSKWSFFRKLAICLPWSILKKLQFH